MTAARRSAALRGPGPSTQPAPSTGPRPASWAASRANDVCATLNPGATATQINAAITACPSGQVVSLAAGTYSISDDGVVMKSGVTLRGAGADKTLLVFSTTKLLEPERRHLILRYQ